MSGTVSRPRADALQTAEALLIDAHANLRPGLSPVEWRCLLAACEETLEERVTATHGEAALARLRDEGLLGPAAGTRSPWWHYNWVRGYAQLAGALNERAAAPRGEVREAAPWPSSMGATASLNTALQRRSVRQFARDPVDAAALDRVVEQAWPAFAACGLQLHLLVQGVAGMARGIHRWVSARSAWHQTAGGWDKQMLLRAAQGQYWVLSKGGGVLFIVVDWDRGDRATQDGYMELLLDLGRCAQRLVAGLTEEGLGGWMTPALDEALASELLGLDRQREEAVYLLKFGLPLQ